MHTCISIFRRYSSVLRIATILLCSVLYVHVACIIARAKQALLEGQVQEATAEAARSQEALALALSQATDKEQELEKEKEKEGEQQASEAASKAEVCMWYVSR